jgi:hypothetical protein
MKAVLFFSAIAGVSAFAPVSQTGRVTSELSAGVEGLRGGNGPESGGKVVSDIKEKTILRSLVLGWSSHGCLFML